MIGRRTVLAGGAAAAMLPRAALAAARGVYRAKIALEGDRVLVAVGIAGKGPYIFMIDTGGVVSLIHDSLAKELKLSQIGHSALGGAGGADIYPLYKARDFVIGGTIRQASVALVGAGELNFGEDIEGTLAAGIITVIDSELDFDAGELRMYPDGRGERPGFAHVRSSIRRLGSSEGEESPYIFADVAMNGRSLDTMLDTGAPGFLSLGPAAARASGLWDDTRPFSPYRPQGVGGQGQLGRFIRVPSVTFGGVTIDRPIVTLRGQGTGIKAGAEIGDAIGGLALIRLFNLSVDAGSRQLWVQRSREQLPDQHYGMSGLWLERAADGIKVEVVGTGSPGAAAGILAGDSIVDMAWGPLLAMINGKPGDIVKLTIVRDGARRPVEFALKPYL